MKSLPVFLALALLALVEASQVAKTELPAAPATDAPAGPRAGTAWITVGDDALAVLKEAVPLAKVMESRQVPVNAVEGRTALTRVRTSEGVHVVALDESAMDAFTSALHQQSKRCGGFMRHESLAEALAVLDRLESGSRRRALTTGALTTAAAPSVPSYAIDNVAQVNALLPQLQASNLMSTIDQLAAFQNRRFQSSGGVASSDWLYSDWQQLIPGGSSGMSVTQVSHPGWPQKAVVFEFQGSSNASEIVVLGAHLDSIAPGNMETVRAPGADDDASGVAGLTEVIRVLVANNYKPQRTLRFIAYDAEEVGLQGSQIFAQNAQATGEQVVGVLQLDMTAYQGDPTDLWIITDYTDDAQNHFLARLAAAYLPELTVGYTACGYGCSDHAAWTYYGFAASFPFEASFAHDNHNIHTPNDTTAVFGYQAGHALKFTKLLLAFAVELGSDGPNPNQPVLTSIALTPNAVATGTTGYFTYSAVGKDQNGYAMRGGTFTYQSSNPSVATVDASGVARGVSPGVTFVTARSGSITSNTATLTIQPEAPMVVLTIAAPADNAAVTGTVVISGTVSTSAGISRVEVQVDGGPYTSAALTTLPSGASAWQSTLDTGQLSNGAHAVTVRATDLVATQVSASITINVNSVPAPTPTPTYAPSATYTPTPTPTPPAPTATPTATPTAPPPTPTATPTRTPTLPAPTATPTPIGPPPTATPTPVPLAGSRFYTLTPCRVLDTRNASGPLGGPALGASASRTFTLTNVCGVPSDAKTLSANVTITGAVAAGELAIYPATLATAPSTSTISFRAGQTRANNAHLLLATDGTGRLVVKNNSAGTVHLILDVNGFYR